MEFQAGLWCSVLKAGESSNRLSTEFAERDCGAVAVEVIAEPPTPGPAIRGTMSIPNLVGPVTRFHKIAMFQSRLHLDGALLR